MDINKEEVCISVHEHLKPLCNNLLLNPTKQNVTKLQKFLPEIPPQVLQMYQNYILFPMELHLYQVENTEIQRHLVDCLAILIKLTDITSVDKLIHLSGLLYQRISSGKDHVSLAEVSEELKLSVVQCIKILFIRADSTVLHEFYTRKFYPRLSSLVFICTLIAKEERLIHLRVAALECILTLANVNDTSNSEDTTLRNSVRNVIMLMLPGIISTCVAIANDSDLQNHNISVANLRVWSQMTSLVMEDDKDESQSYDMTTILQKMKKASVIQNNNTKEAKINIPFTNLKEKIENMKKQERTEKWLAETAKKLAEFTKEMTKYQSHSHYATRKQLSISCQFILQKCSRNMAPSVSELVSTLIILWQDEMQEVTVVAQEALKWFACECEQESGKSLFEIVEEDFYSLLSRMPRIMREQDEKRQLSCLSLLEGYLKLQDKKLPQVLSSRLVVNRLIMSLILTVSIETSGVILLEDCSIRDVETDSVQHSLLDPWKNLKYCNEKQMLNKLENICNALLNSGNLLHLVHALLEALDEMADHRKEIILILNMMLTSSMPNSMEQHAELIHNVVDIYLEPRFWNLPISVTQGVDPADTILQAQSNVIQACLLVEGIGKFALVLGGSSFSSCLVSCLYPTLERAGSPLALIATAGLRALQNIAKACVGGGVTDLVRNNVDYLSHHITTRLRNAHRNPSVLPVLSVVMKHSTVDVLPSLHEIITDVLVQSCDIFQEQSGSAYLRVFYTFMVCVNNWYKEDFLLTSQTFQKPPNPPSIVQKLLEYKQLKNEANNFEDIDETKTTEEMYREDELKRHLEEVIEEEPTIEKKQLPPHIELTVDILNRSLHFLPSKDEGRQILVLQILREGVLILKNYEEQLLPTVHKIWSPLVNRFQLSLTKPLVMQYAFQLLCVLASAAKDFIRSRTLKSVLPSLCEILLQSVNQSRLKDSGSVYRHTQLYKLQSHLLTNLGQLVIDIGLQERDLYLILIAATPYLSVQQPIPLQEESMSLFKTISTLNQDIVWLQLLSIWTPTVKLKPPSTDFQVVKLSANNMDSSVFKKNVSELFEFLT